MIKLSMLKILTFYKKSRFYFPATWLLGFSISAITWFIVREVKQNTSFHIPATINYSIRGWPNYYGVTTFGGSWTYRSNDFFINGVIWWLLISLVIEIYLRVTKRYSNIT